MRDALLINLLLLLVFPSKVLPLPVGGKVVGGSATINQSNSQTLNINQLTGKAIINWKGFNINVNELVKFNQPGVNSVVLNRVTGVNPSSILGRLIANGRVFIVNPNGVFFGPNSIVDVAGLLATTLNIKDSDFLADKYEFTRDLSKGASYVINQGQIKVSDNGFVFLVSAGVANQGLVIANLGKVVMGSGEKLTVDFMGDGLITFALEGKVASQIIGLDGARLDSAVANAGAIKADGGQVFLSARASSEVFSSVVNNSGVIEARSLVNRGGIIRLEGSDPVTNTGAIGWQTNLGKVQNTDGRVLNTGTLDISAREAGAAQGEVTLSGQMVGVSGSIIARGAEGAQGGRALITSSEKTVLTQDSVIDTSGLGNSSAGNIVVWSDKDTVFRGSIIAKGGEIGGDGGHIEVSGHENLHFTGQVNALAPLGTTGSLLLDPLNITVATGGAATLLQVDQFSDTPATNQTIAPATINGAAANVTLQANNDITVSNAIAMTNAGVGIAMQAGRDINVNASVSTNNGNISLTANDSTAIGANRANATTGDIAFGAGANLSAGTGNITLTIDPSTTNPFNPGSITVVRNLTTTTGNVSINSPNNVTFSGAVNAGSGTVTIEANADGAGAQGFTMNAGSSITTTNATANAVQINVNAGGGGTGTAALRDITTGSGGTLTVATNTGGNSTGGDITQTAGTLLNVGSGAINLSTAPIASANIGSSGANILTTASNITASTGTSGVYITESDGANFTAAATGGGAITLTSTTGAVSIAGATSTGTGAITLTGDTVNVNNSLTNSGAITLTGQAVNINGVVSGTGALAINPLTAAGDLTVSSSGANNVTDGFSSITIGNSAGTGAVVVNALTVSDPLTIRSPTTTGTVTVNGAITGLGNGSVTITGGTGATPIILNAGITTAGNAITLSDNVGLGGNVTIDSTNGGGSAGGAAISFTGTIAADEVANNRTLTINSGTGGNTTLSGAVGSNQALQSLTVANSNVLSLQGVTTTSDIQLNAQNAVTLNGAVNAGSGTVTIAANRDGGGGEDFTMNAGSSITTTNATANAVQINVNAAAGGTGDAFLRDITTGSGGILSVATNTGGNTTGDDITQTAGTLLNVGTGTMVLTTPSNTASNIGTSGTPLSTVAGTIIANSGTNGVFITESDGASFTVATGGVTINLASTTGDLLANTISAPGGTVTLSAPGGAIQDGNGGANNITADNLTASAATGINLDTSINTLTSVTVTGTGHIDISNLGALSVTNATTANGNIAISNNAGDMTINSLTAVGGGVNLTANAGSILDGNGAANNLTAAADSTLRALGGVVGLSADPVEVDINPGSLGVEATGQIGGVSVNIDGTVMPSNTLAILNSPPGKVIFNGNELIPPTPPAPPTATTNFTWVISNVDDEQVDKNDSLMETLVASDGELDFEAQLEDCEIAEKANGATCYAAGKTGKDDWQSDREQRGAVPRYDRSQGKWTSKIPISDKGVPNSAGSSKMNKAPAVPENPDYDQSTD